MIRKQLTSFIRRTIVDVLEKMPADIPADIHLETPPRKDYGDFSTNTAMVLASQLKKPPREVAGELLAKMQGSPPGFIERIEIAGPGFINFFLNPDWLHECVRAILNGNGSYGRCNIGEGRRVLIEFVSANPNGPIHIGHGRGGVIGDVLANLLEAIGYEVDREFYINDAATSGQMQKFGRSLEARYFQLQGIEKEIPEDGYHGDYVTDLAREILDAEGARYNDMSNEDRLRTFTNLAQEKMIEHQRETLERFGITFDNWFSEQTLVEAGRVEQAIEALKARGHTYEEDGALWLRSTEFGDDKDRVLVRNNGVPTYLASDVAYHTNKFERGYDLLIDIWGPDHHGYMIRTTAAAQAVGYAPERLHIFVHQIVRLLSEGELVRASKRAGDLVTLDEILDAVGKDVARFFYLMRSHDSHLDFDLDLARKESQENPVYYVQYAHARICSILRDAEDTASERSLAAADLSLLNHETEVSLMRKLADLPEEVKLAAAEYAPHRLTRYAQELASSFHCFYTECRVLSDDDALTLARLALLRATQIVLQVTLGLLGVDSPERM
ncbi:MAG: arginine--tRNA ligase [Armatimonadetes bacterium CG2_30_59_28]|nr:arginine--tRNA ligase [Armatimonadota bacterium]OIO96640.1 MAG: arginine--tRNA ligase [Armatimonadetes bacterium CG2_30_59_28]PIU67082.1 MAG: arginine--tRNA ligase [Armatimonadetes bacterium CG07_land_8_20_14_0_80_59_28]PIX40028.1 MAG: arginine--tRNA ligase [Armatimonadetes bacterium CG_4_8_14_3_um_filter_58_9]PIY39599.1 MAG: arginine--tRNA ligase [Armatimonadetes bacterium CG_4_10_14_3_um_filter_59_10]